MASWLDIGLAVLPKIGGFISGGRSGEGITKDDETGKITGAGMGTGRGFMAAAADRFKLPGEALPANVTLLTRGLGGSTQGLTNLERILAPIHKLQANGYDALANSLIQAAIKKDNTISGKDLLSEATTTAASQTIKLGAMK